MVVAESSLLSLSVGLLIMAAAGFTVAGVTWGRLTSKMVTLSEQLADLRKAITHLDRAGREDSVALGQRYHDLASRVQDLEVRAKLLEHEAGIPIHAREDRTPVTTMPRRQRLPSGGHGTPDESR